MITLMDRLTQSQKQHLAEAREAAAWQARSEMLEQQMAALQERLRRAEQPWWRRWFE